MGKMEVCPVYVVVSIDKRPHSYCSCRVVKNQVIFVLHQPHHFYPFHLDFSSIQTRLSEENTVYSFATRTWD